jgi:hypothetical protein
MALVLIIIGIIIGAVVKGKDLITSAEQKRIYSKFLNEWQLLYLNFYDRTGKILGDTWNQAGGAIGQDGQADTAAGTNGATPTNAGRTELITSGSPASYLGLSQVGLTTPVTNIPANAWQYKYVDSQGNAHLLDIAFEWSGTYNYMMINNMPAELGMAIDTMIDGQADGTVGDFIYFTGGAPTAWPATPTTDCNDVRWRMKF